jgi:5-formyltetrahydrofolate cyclo-ligase
VERCASMTNDPAALKTALRAKLRFRRDQYAAQLDDFVRAIAFRAPPSPLRQLLSEAVCVGAYHADSSEAPVDGLITFAADAGVTTALPYFAARDPAMTFTLWRPGDPVAAGPWRVSQPAEVGSVVVPDLLLCPLLGFDRSGGRIGQGGGHYDRYFASHPAALRVGIAWSVQEVDTIPLEAHDLPLDAVLTEQEWILTGDRL